MNKKKVLSIIPPYIPSYFNAGHHLPVFSVAAYIRSKFEHFEVHCIDAGALNYTWRDICTILVKNYDFILMMNDFDAIDNYERFIQYARKLSPSAQLITFGRLSKLTTNFFEKLDLDAIVVSGDPEVGIELFIKYTLGLAQPPPGVIIKKNNVFTKATTGMFLSPEEWVLPDINDIPYSAYDPMYDNDLNKFCGIPSRRELVIEIARGCPVGCSFCDVPIIQGSKERRISTDRVIDYLIENFRERPFEYFSFYCPTFTLDKVWVQDFCMKKIAKDFQYPWKCATVGRMLDEKLIKLMSEAGCIRISIGVETLNKFAASSLPKVKQNGETQLIYLARLCKKYGIELNCFVILGLPNESLMESEITINKILNLNCRVRPTVYTPFFEINNKTNINEINKYNRQLFLDGTINPEDEYSYYNLIYNNKNDFKSNLMEKIPTKNLK